MDMQYLREYNVSLKEFAKLLPARKQIRAEYEQSLQAEKEAWRQQRSRLQQEKAGQGAAAGK